MSSTKTTAPTADDKYVCIKCYRSNVEISLPAWFDPNNELELLSLDASADELSTWCRDCEDHCVLRSPDGHLIAGRY